MRHQCLTRLELHLYCITTLYATEWLIKTDLETHLFALHYTLILRINKCLQEFKSQWENHPLSFEKKPFSYSTTHSWNAWKWTLRICHSWKCVLILVIGMIIELTPLPLSLWKKTIRLWFQIQVFHFLINRWHSWRIIATPCKKMTKAVKIYTYVLKLFKNFVFSDFTGYIYQLNWLYLQTCIWY